MVNETKTRTVKVQKCKPETRTKTVMVTKCTPE